MLPNFLIIGSMKSGTTSLYSYLRSHPDIFMPDYKEPGFFSNDEVWAKGISWYENLFSNYQNQKACGEASTNYSKFPNYPDVPARISSIVPHMKMIYILRHPVERIYSHYLHNLYSGRETLSLEDALNKKTSYIQVSLYYKQIERYLTNFPENQLMVVLLEDLKTQPSIFMYKIFKFLDVSPEFISTNIFTKKNQTKLKRGKDNCLMKAIKNTNIFNSISSRISDEAKSRLTVILKNKINQPDPMADRLYEKIINEISPDMKKLSQFLKRDLKCWNLCTGQNRIIN